MYSLCWCTHFDVYVNIKVITSVRINILPVSWFFLSSLFPHPFASFSLPFYPFPPFSPTFLLVLMVKTLKLSFPGKLSVYNTIWLTLMGMLDIVYLILCGCTLYPLTPIPFPAATVLPQFCLIFSSIPHKNKSMLYFSFQLS